MSDEFVCLVDTLHKSTCGSALVSSHVVCVCVYVCIDLLRMRV